MNWSDERYVRLFTRDTVTWLRWSFETRAVFSLLLRKVDRSGVLETGRGDKAEALALTLMAPIETCRKALSELTACGTVALGDASLVIPRFIEAQECRMSDAARQKESREKRAVAKLQNHNDACHTPSHDVTAGHAVSHAVTPAVPSRAVPPVPSVPSQPKETTTLVEQAPLVSVPPTPRPTRVKPMAIKTDDLTDEEWNVFQHWRTECRHPQALLDPKRLSLIRRWLATPGVTVERLQKAITGCSRSAWHRGENQEKRRHDDLELILRDAAQLEKFEGMAA
jgi:hypothetical protein